MGGSVKGEMGEREGRNRGGRVVEREGVGGTKKGWEGVRGR